MKKYEAPEIVVLNVNGTEIFTSGGYNDMPDEDLPVENW